MRALVDGGCDVVEVGVPYSDPVMDGPTIQRGHRTGRAGRRRRAPTRCARSRAVADAGAAAVTMGYWNQVERYGVERFAAELADGRRVGRDHARPDPRRGGRVDRRLRRRTSLDRIFLVAPSSTDARIASTAARLPRVRLRQRGHGRDRGARRASATRPRTLVERVRALAPDIPVCVGLGVSTGAQAAQVARFADGVIVGSALVKRLLDSRTRRRGCGPRTGAELAEGVRRR